MEWVIGQPESFVRLGNVMTKKNQVAAYMKGDKSSDGSDPIWFWLKGNSNPFVAYITEEEFLQRLDLKEE